VRAPANDVATALSQRYKGTVEKVDPANTDEKHPDISNVVFQHAGHDYSIFASTDMSEDLTSGLSKSLKTRAICLAYEDTGGWTECRVFDNGEDVETYTFGPDYAEEMESIADELGEDFEMQANDGGKPWDHQVNDGDGNDFRFRSSLRKAEKEDVSDSTKMIDQTFAAAQAWLPGWANFPFQNPQEYPDSAKSEFNAAFKVKPG